MDQSRLSLMTFPMEIDLFKKTMSIRDVLELAQQAGIPNVDVMNVREGQIPQYLEAMKETGVRVYTYITQISFLGSEKRRNKAIRTSLETAKLLKHQGLIALNQDPDTRPPLFIRENTGNKEALLTFRHLSENRFAFGFFNPYETDKTFMIPYYEIGLDPLCGYGFDVTDAVTGERLGIQKEYIQVKVPAGDCRVLTGTLVKVK